MNRRKLFYQLSCSFMLALLILLLPCSVFASRNMSSAQFKEFQQNQRMFQKFRDESERNNPQFTPTPDEYEQGSKFLDQGKYDEAISSFSRIIESQASLDKAALFNALKQRGRAYYYKNQYDSAIADYNIAIAVDPSHKNSDSVYNNRGLAYSSKGQYDTAIMDYNTALVLNPRLADAYSNRGLAYFSKSNYETAIMDCNMALALDSKFSPAYYNKAIICDKLGRNSEAIQAYTLFLKYALSTSPDIEKAKQRIKSMGGVI